jgi:hypothetical protein
MSELADILKRRRSVSDIKIYSNFSVDDDSPKIDSPQSPTRNVAAVSELRSLFERDNSKTPDVSIEPVLSRRQSATLQTIIERFERGEHENYVCSHQNNHFL